MHDLMDEIDEGLLPMDEVVVVNSFSRLVDGLFVRPFPVIKAPSAFREDLTSASSVPYVFLAYVYTRFEGDPVPVLAHVSRLRPYEERDETTITSLVGGRPRDPTSPRGNRHCPRSPI